MLTETQKRALTIIRDCPGIGAREFFKRMWPDSPHAKGRGTGAQKAGGSYVGKLVKLGWVKRLGQYCTEYYLTEEGKKVLDEI
jgi:hypothetical protein